MLKNSGFSTKSSGLGGICVVVPIAREGMGGELGRRERSLEREEGWSWMY